MIVSIIVACGYENFELGGNSKLLWNLPSEMKMFKSLTTGHHLILGRKTFESIGRPLKDRKVIVLTKSEPQFLEEFYNVKCASSFSDALAIADDAGETEVFVGGGAEVYKLALDSGYVCKMYLTYVKIPEEIGAMADTFFPANYCLRSWYTKDTDVCFKQRGCDQYETLRVQIQNYPIHK